MMFSFEQIKHTLFGIKTPKKILTHRFSFFFFIQCIKFKTLTKINFNNLFARYNITTKVCQLRAR